MEKLSEDVLRNIFIRLPAKQLFQMKCVCKPWNAFLSAKSSYFIKSHLNHSIRNIIEKDNEIVLAFSPYYLPPLNQVFPYKLTGSSPIMEINDHVKLPVFPEALHVIGSVNGLICFYIGYDDHKNKGIYIWNPSLSVVMTLPPFFDQQRKTDPSVHNGYRYMFCFGFGFDPKTDDYKVVKLTEDCEESDSWGEPVEVYSMKNGSWEFIVDRFPKDVDEAEGGFVDDHDGHLHRLCDFYKEVDDFKRIVVFDLGMNSFHHILLPDSIANYDEYRRHNVLGMLGGKLCVVSCTRDMDDGKFEVWVMNEYGVADSWVKSHVLSKLNLEAGTRRRPIGFTLNNRFLFRDPSKGLLGCYDQETDKVTHFGSDTYGVAGVVQYVDSLVWYAPPTT